MLGKIFDCYLTSKEYPHEFLPALENNVILQNNQRFGGRLWYTHNCGYQE